MSKILRRIRKSRLLKCIRPQGDNLEGESKAETFSDIAAQPKVEEKPAGGPENRSGLNNRQVFLLKQNWKGVMRVEEEVSMDMHLRLFKTNAELQSLFQGFKDIRSDDELRSNEALEYHATLVMTTLDDAITHIDNYDFVKNLLHRTGCSHVKFSGFEPDNFMAIKEPFLEAVKVTLGDRYTENMQNIYDVAITFILGTLVEGIKEGLQNQADANDKSAAVCPVKHD